MAKLTFSRAAINAIAKQAKATGSTHLYLVGDYGVYFMNAAQQPPRRRTICLILTAENIRLLAPAINRAS